MQSLRGLKFIPIRLRTMVHYYHCQIHILDTDFVPGKIKLKEIHFGNAGVIIGLNPTGEYQIREGGWFPFPLKPVMEELVEEISIRIPYILIRLIWL